MTLPKFVDVYMKHNDMTYISLDDENGITIEEMDSNYLPCIGPFGGDDTHLKIDNETGKILNWVPIKTLKNDE